MSIQRIGGFNPHVNAQYPAELEELLDALDASEVAYSDPGASSLLANVDDIAELVSELAAQVAGTGVVEALEDVEGEPS